MEIAVKVDVKAPPEQVWRVVADIEHSDKVVSAIQKIEVLERGKEGLTGFKWKETRTMFGKTAEETMTVTEAVENKHYITEAESHGSKYKSRISVEGKGDTTELRMTFGAEPVSLAAKIMSPVLGRLFVGATKKALQQDLEDVKRHVESSP